ncbi:alpha-E domain-containing protein [Herpetosiphon sp. NSE202]|uniref:alpha-E domain-containing protein n=1 Tax=Herpetosiphon sp. NSE202 TaxID=3351349 RepID=UPI003638D985
MYTADIRPERIAEFLLLNAESPRSLRCWPERLFGEHSTTMPTNSSQRLSDLYSVFG